MSERQFFVMAHANARANAVRAVQQGVVFHDEVM